MPRSPTMTIRASLSVSCAAIAAYTSSTLTPATPRSGLSVTSSHQVSVDSFEPGATIREMTRARARSRCRDRRAEQRGQARLRGHGVHGGDVAVRQRPGDRHRLSGRDQGGAGQRCLDQADRLLRQPGQIRQGLVLDLGYSMESVGHKIAQVRVTEVLQGVTGTSV